MPRGKKYTAIAEKIDADKTYTLAEALQFLADNKVESFDASVEVHCNLGIDPKKTDQQLRSTVVLPHGTGKDKRVAAFVGPDKEAEAKEAGAALVGGEELVAEIKKTEKTDFDVAVATPQMMPKIAGIAKILGTRGLMPSPKNDTVTDNIGQAVADLKGGKVAFKNDNTANIHQVVGRLSFGADKLTENITTFVEAIKKAKPAGSKGTYIKSLSICTTMGPSIQISL